MALQKYMMQKGNYITFLYVSAINPIYAPSSQQHLQISAPETSTGKRSCETNAASQADDITMQMGKRTLSANTY
jgi:hypothetical protein